MRRRAAAGTPNFSVPHVSSSVFKAPISARRYGCFSPLCPVGNALTGATDPGRPGPLSHHEAANSAVSLLTCLQAA